MAAMKELANAKPVKPHARSEHHGAVWQEKFQNAANFGKGSALPPKVASLMRFTRVVAFGLWPAA